MASGAARGRTQRTVGQLRERIGPRGRVLLGLAQIDTTANRDEARLRTPYSDQPDCNDCDNHYRHWNQCFAMVHMDLQVLFPWSGLVVR